MPIVTVIVVAIELMMTGRFDATGWTDLAISAALSILAIQVAARLTGRIVIGGLIYILCFTLTWYALTLIALPGTETLTAGSTPLVADGALTPAGHFHFLSRPFRFATFTLLLALMAVWGLYGGKRKDSGG